MSRTVLHGGRIFDGTGSPVADGDLLIEDGRIREIGLGLDGDERVDVTGMTLLPGLFDCHVHVTSSGVDLLRRLQQPFSYQFYEAARNLAATLDCGITTVRDAGGADLGIQRAVDDGLIEGPRPGCRSWRTPRRPTASRTPSVRAFVRSSTASTSTTRPST
ncbi:MAG TPA: amidohydrolase family protein [Trebonia sp.]|jgi:imidazolonepropionase-like amidohydrolase